MSRSDAEGKAGTVEESGSGYGWPFFRPSAMLSPCRTWRYSLSRTWNEAAAPLVVIGLNPSTADETKNDPTIRRCIRFAHDWGHGGLVMLNLFAFRATDPDDLRRAADPRGPENDTTLLRETEGRSVLAAWGIHGELLGRDAAVMGLLVGRDVFALVLTKSGAPRHPLYCRADLKPVRYPSGRV